MLANVLMNVILFTNPIILFVERVYVPTSKDTMRDTFKQCYNFANLQIGAPFTHKRPTNCHLLCCCLMHNPS
jgi:hypothetical protein